MNQFVRSLLYFAIFVSVFSLARLLLAILYFPFFRTLDGTQLLFSFVEGLRFDLASTTVLIFVPILSLNIPFRFGSNRYWSGLFSWSVFFVLVPVLALLIADVVYFDFVKRHISYELLQMRGDDTATVVGMSTSIFLPHLILFLTAVVLLSILWYRIAKRPTRRFYSWKSYWLRFVLLFVALVVAGRGGIGSKPITIIDAFSSGDTKYGNLVLNGVFSIMHSSLKHENVGHRFFSEEEALAIALDGSPVANKEYPVQKVATGSEEAPRLNLVFVLIESLSHKYVDVFSASGYGVTPNLDRLARQGVMFTNFFASGQRSVEGLQATLTGMASTIGLPTIGIGLLANYSKLGYLAQDNGYTTVFVQSLKRRSFRTDAIAGSTGFQEFYGMEDMLILLDYPDPTAAKYGWDYETYMLAAEKMEKAKKPFFFYIVTSTTHTPYPRLPKNLEKYPHSQNREEGFLNTLHYSDWSIGEFLERLKGQPWFEDTVFVFTADHALAHYQSGSFVERFHIPLILYSPGIFPPKVVSAVSSQLDLFATTIDILKLSGKYSTLGTSLLAPRRKPFALIREGSVVGIIGDGAYLRHSLKNRLETGNLDPSGKEADFQAMERKLLAADQLTYELIQSNRWAEQTEY